MNLEAFKEFAHRLTYKGKPCVSVHNYDWRNGFAPVPEGYVYVSVWINAFDVDDGKPTKIEGGGLMAIKDIEGSSEWSHITYFKNQIIGLETHEVEETLALDGVRVFNPHERVTELKSELKEAA